jgi:hypothetical protein
VLSGTALRFLTVEFSALIHVPTCTLGCEEDRFHIRQI